MLSATDPARGFEGLSIRGPGGAAAAASRGPGAAGGSLGGRLPPELEAIRELLAADSREALRGLRVIRVEDVPALSRWQRALIEKLNRDAGESSSQTKRSLKF